MRHWLTSLTLLLLLASCSTAYRNGQTPDDVYFSPVTTDEGTVIREHQSAGRPNEMLYGYDRSIRMRIYDPRWRFFEDDFQPYYHPYAYGYTYGYYYNPYYCPYPVYVHNGTVRNPKNSTPRMTSLGSYHNPQYAVSNIKTNTGQWIRVTDIPAGGHTRPVRIRESLTPTYEPSADRPVRSYQPGTSGSGSSSGSTPIARPERSR